MKHLSMVNSRGIMTWYMLELCCRLPLIHRAVPNLPSLSRDIAFNLALGSLELQFESRVTCCGWSHSVYIHNMVCLLVMAALNYVNFMLIAGIPVFFCKPAEPELFFRYFKNFYLFLFRFHLLDVYGFLAGNMPVIWIFWIFDIDLNSSFLPSEFFRFVGGQIRGWRTAHGKRLSCLDVPGS